MPFKPWQNNSCLVLIQSNLSEFVFLNSLTWPQYRQRKYMTLPSQVLLPCQVTSILKNQEAHVPPGSYPVTYLAHWTQISSGLKGNLSGKVGLFEGSQGVVMFLLGSHWDFMDGLQCHSLNWNSQTDCCLVKYALQEADFETRHRTVSQQSGKNILAPGELNWTPTSALIHLQRWI